MRAPNPELRGSETLVPSSQGSPPPAAPDRRETASEAEATKFCVDEALDLNRSPTPVPAPFHGIPFNFDRYPGASGVSGVAGGANCQLYAYEFLRHHGFVIGDLRSSNLWEDTEYTYQVDQPEPFDLLMVHDLPEAWGAHVLVCVGKNFYLHLSRRIGRPAVETLEEVLARPYYQCLIGFKRCRVRRATSGAPSA